MDNWWSYEQGAWSSSEQPNMLGFQEESPNFTTFEQPSQTQTTSTAGWGPAGYQTAQPPNSSYQQRPGLRRQSTPSRALLSSTPPLQLGSPAMDAHLDASNINPRGSPSPGPQEGDSTSGPGSKARKRTSSTTPPAESSELSRLDHLLLQLKGRDGGPSWNTIAVVVEEQLGEKHRVAALQMRYQRLRKRLRSANREPQDNDILRAALDYWQSSKWEIVAQKMKELGADRTWTAQECEQRWLVMQLERLPIDWDEVD